MLYNVMREAHRTQLYLDEARYQYLQCLARKNHVSLAQVVRDLIDRHKEARSKRKQDSFFHIIGMVSRPERPDFAEHIDDYLYGAWDGESEPPKD